MLHAGLDLSRDGFDVCLLSEHCEVLEQFAAPSISTDGLRGASALWATGARRDRVDDRRAVRARHVRAAGSEVLIADAEKGAPLTCKTDPIDARVLAVVSHRDLVPAIWLPDARVRRARAGALPAHLVKHRSMLKHRIHSTPITFVHPCPVTDLFGVAGRELLDRIAPP